MARKPADPSQLNQIAKRFFDRALDRNNISKGGLTPTNINVRRNSSWSNI